MSRSEARKVATLLENRGHYGIEIVESWPEHERSVRSLNACGMRRTYISLSDAELLP